MALHVLPYAVKHYNSLPELRVAEDQFESARASEILFTEIGKAFVKHHVQNTLGITLLHNHFLLKHHEMLVNVDSVAVPWNTTSGATELAGVNVSAWRFTDQGLASYEFAHAAVEVSLHRHPMQSFLLIKGKQFEVEWLSATGFSLNIANNARVRDLKAVQHELLALKGMCTCTETTAICGPNARAVVIGEKVRRNRMPQTCFP